MDILESWLVRRSAGVIAVVITVLALPSPLEGQEAASSANQGEALRTFLDCRSRYCDFDHFRREIPFVSYVRNRQDAQLHVLVTTLRTGGGGLEFTVEFVGRGEFAALQDSLVYYSSDTDTFDEVRAGLTQTLKLGMMRYVARLPTGRDIEISYEGTGLPLGDVEDPWNYWIFRVRVSGSLSGEQRQRFFAGSLSLFANRTTEEWKIRLFVEGSYAEDRFELSDGSELSSVFRSYGGGVFVANSLGEHWSVAGVAEANTSTYRNEAIAVEAGPGIEYSVFPYSESTRRALTVLYTLQVRGFVYDETTIFGKDSEVRPAQFVELAYSVDQTWGSIDARLEGFNYIDDFARHRVDLSGRINLRVVRGLELSLRGSVARTKDQITLARGEATDEEILLQRRELGTDYRFQTSISLSYTFGSIYNNVVNPRFD